MDSVVVSVRVKKSVKQKLENEGIDVEKMVREFINQKAAQAELRAAVKRMHRIISESVKPSKKGFAVESVKEDRRAAH